jgi:hypothetical protein
VKRATASATFLTRGLSCLCLFYLCSTRPPARCHRLGRRQRAQSPLTQIPHPAPLVDFVGASWGDGRPRTACGTWPTPSWARKTSSRGCPAWGPTRPERWWPRLGPARQKQAHRRRPRGKSGPDY